MIRHRQAVEQLPPVDEPILNVLVEAASVFLIPERARRWEAILRSGKNYKKLSPWELLDDARRAPTTIIVRFRSWTAFEREIASFLDDEVVALGEFEGDSISVKARTCSEIVRQFEDRYMDAWVVDRTTRVCFVSTHERDLVIIRATVTK